MAREDFIPKNFLVAHANEGPQVVIDWENPLNTSYISAYKLLRRERIGFSKDIEDGILLYEGLETAFVDLEGTLVDGEIYYYTLFVQYNADNEASLAGWYTESSLQESVLAIKTGFFEDFLFESVTNFVRSLDGQHDLIALLRGP